MEIQYAVEGSLPSLKIQFDHSAQSSRYIYKAVTLMLAMDTHVDAKPPPLCSPAVKRYT